MHRAAIAGGTIVETRESPSPDVIVELAQKLTAADSPHSERLLILGGVSKALRNDYEAIARRIAATSPSWSHVIVFGPNAKAFAKLTSKCGVTITPVVGRYALRDLIVKHWESSDSPALAVASSRGPNLAWAIDDALGTALSMKSAGVSMRSTRVESSRTKFDLISGVGAVAVGPGSQTRELVLPSTVAGMGLLAIRQGAYSGHSLTTLMVPAPLRTVGASAFRDCESLARIVLPSSLVLISGRAFQNAKALMSVDIPDSVTTIGQRAFAGCTSLRRVTLPSGRVSIAKDAFDGCHPELRFAAVSGSHAERWARQRNIPLNTRPPHGNRSPLGVYPHDTRRIKHQGVEYRLLPGGMLEAWNSASGLNGSVLLPAEVEGYPVRGIGVGFIGPDSGIKELELPPSVSWISSHAFSPESQLSRVRSSGPLQARGEGEAVERLVRINIDRARDVDSIRLTMRMVCSLLRLELPASFEYMADEPLMMLSASMLTSGKGGLHFSRARALTPKTVDRLLTRGVRAFVSTGPFRSGDGSPTPYLYHPDPKQAFEQLSAWFATQYDVTTIAVTGSVGKTSTKEMLQRVSSTSRATLYSAKNQNGIIQVGRYVQKLTDKTEIYIQETGAGAPRLVERGAQILRPDAFIITNIGLNHIARYGGSKERVLADKLSLDAYMPDAGVAFVNYDDPRLRTVQLRHQIVSYGVDSRDVDYWAEDIVEQNGRLEFTIVEACSGSRSDAVVHSFGRHNVSNAVVAFAVGRWLRIPRERILEGIAGYRGEGLRQNLTEIDGRRVLVDCYNASEVAISTTADALQTLSVDGHGRRIYVVADIDDKLGDITEEVHRRVGRELATRTGIDRFYLFGPHAAWIAEELRSQGRDAVDTVDRDDLHEALKIDLTEHDVVAFKGGQQMALSITIDRLFGTAFVLSDGDVLEKRGTDIIDDDVQYRSIDEYGVELRRLRQKDEIATLEVARAMNGSPVLMIGKSACARTRIETVSIPEPVTTIAQAAFFQATALSRVDLPSTLLTIGASAFNGCSAMRELVIPEGVTTIGHRAFYRCTNLQRLVLPTTLRTIDPEILLHCGAVTVECPEGSFAEQLIRQEYPNVKMVAV